ncbi:cryptochrome/photolyase family protein [Haloarchaeobius sp. HRN-SO-5]|uniref:cryptochrome/photolyase family protein n=1 Tax=Haloarchaeobius sp. HRN-SO-5 TaxID=3446118 RepID=UPI003EB771E7
MTVWVLGDQLSTDAGPLGDLEPGAEPVLLVEATRFARRLPYHPHKLVGVFAAMRHFRDRLRSLGHEVDYRHVETFEAGVRAHLDDYPDQSLVTMAPASDGAPDRIRALVASAGGSLDVVESDLFCCSVGDFDEWAGDDDTFVHESFYRWQRRRTGYLMDGDDPVGDEWNFDEQNREFPGPEYRFPDPPTFHPDETTRAVVEWVHDEFDPWAGDDAEPFAWPVTREESLEALDSFVADRLPSFGPYQDAMVQRSWLLNHALLSPALNLGLLHPRECIEAAIDAYEAGDAPLPSVEGFVRQVLGWREFVRHVYRRSMPDLATANQFGHDRDLPTAYYTGDAEMRCLSECVGHVRKRGYAHHIERLMVLSNFATLYGADPRELNRWFHFGFVDAYHWVTTPNVVGMGSFASDVLSTKPYVSSANYVQRTSDFCGDCRYDPDETTGEDACPFNALYWAFLDRHEDRLRSNPRMGLMYHHLDRKDDDELAAIHDRADAVRAMGADGTL